MSVGVIGIGVYVIRYVIKGFFSICVMSSLVIIMFLWVCFVWVVKV